MKKEQKLFWDTLTYLAANFGSRLLLLVIYPVYTFFLLPEELGTYDLIVSTLTLLYPVAVFSISDALFRWLLDSDGESRPGILGVGLKITARNLAVIDGVLGLLLLAFPVPHGWMILGILNTGAVYPVLQQIARGLGKNRVFAASGLVYALVLVAAGCVLVVGLGQKTGGLLLAQLIAYGAACLYLVIFLPELRKLSGTKRETETRMVKYALHLIPNSSCWWIMNASDRYLIRIFLGSAANGIYSVTHRFPSVLNLLTTVFSMAWQEQAIREVDSRQRDAYYSRIYGFYFRLLLCVSLMLIPVTKWFTVLFVESQYADAWRYSGALYLGGVFLALATFLGTGYLSAKNTRGAMVTSLMGAAVNLAADLILLPLMGLEAAALSTLMGNFAVWLARWFQTRQYFCIRVRWGEFWALVLANVAVCVAVRFTPWFWDAALILGAVALLGALNWDGLMFLLGMLKRKKAAP